MGKVGVNAQARGSRRLVGVVIVMALAACAGKPSAPTPPPAPLKRVALLPVVLNSDLEYLTTYRSGMVVAPVPISPGAAVAGALGMGIGLLIKQSRDNDKAQLARAFASIDFRPAETLNTALGPLLESRGIAVDTVTDVQAVIEARHTGEFGQLATDADALLDVRITDLGYYSSMRAGGYSPMIGLTATLMVKNQNDYDSQSFAYWFDWRESKRDPRWFTSPPDLVYRNIDALTADAAHARIGLEEALRKIMQGVVADVSARAAGKVAE